MWKYKCVVPSRWISGSQTESPRRSPRQQQRRNLCGAGQRYRLGFTVRIGRVAARVGPSGARGLGYEAQTIVAKVVWGAEALK
jgi:hypothetical protein